MIICVSTCAKIQDGYSHKRMDVTTTRREVNKIESTALIEGFKEAEIIF